MKKIVSILMALCLILTSIGFALAEDEKALTIWYSGAANGKAAEKAKEIYLKSHPDAIINIEQVATSDRETRLTVALSSSDMSGMPDITLFQDYSAQRFLQFYPGCFVDLSSEINMNDFAQDKVGYWTYEGGVYGLPFDSAASAQFIRVDYLAEAGYTLEDVTDITWDRFIEIGKDVQAKTGKYMLTETNYSNMMMLVLKSTGCWYFNEDGTANIANNEAVKKTLEVIKKLHESGIVKENTDWASFIGSMNDGSAVSTITGNWILGSIVGAQDQSGLWKMTTIPSVDETTGHYSSNGGSSWVVLSCSEQKEFAIDFLKTFLDDDFNTYLVEELATVPTYLTAQKLECINKEYAFTGGQKVFADIMDYTAKTPVVEYGPYNSDIDSVMNLAIQEIIAGKSIEEAMASAQASIDFTMEE